jgi:outer membrane lipoprotein-sorting protein
MTRKVKSMMRFILILGLVFAFQGLYSQKDPQAKSILDKVSSGARGDFPLLVSFEYIYEDLMEKQTTTREGNLILDGNKFRLSLGESVVYCDGQTVWNHIISANEVYISDADEENASEDFFISNPSDLFTFYQEGFKYRLKGEIEHNSRVYNEIDIFPEDLDKNYHTVKLLVDKKNLQLYSARAYGKGGVNHMVILTDYKAGVKTDDKTFFFDEAEHPGAEVVDTRF